MKKIMILIIVSAFLFSGSVFAANTSITSESTTILGGIEYQPSTSVTVLVTSSTSAYGVASKHEQGTVGYSSSDTSSEITETDAAKGTIPTAVTIDGTPTFE